MNYIKSLLSALLLLLVLSSPVFAADPVPAPDSRAKMGVGTDNLDAARLSQRIKEAKSIYMSLLTGPDGGIPEDLTKKSECIGVLPGVLRAAFIAGGRFGKGIITCKNESGQWSPPAYYTLGGGSLGFQIGADSTDLVLFFVNAKAKNGLLNPKFSLGADVAVAAGPVGRGASGQIDTKMTGIYSYAKSKGLFAGLSLQGAVLEPDMAANETIEDLAVIFKQMISLIFHTSFFPSS